MTHDNALRRASADETTRTRIHLVHSYSGQFDRRKRPAARPHLVPRTAPQTAPQIVPPVQSSHRIDTMTLAAAAFTAPVIWLGHAALRLMRVL